VWSNNILRQFKSLKFILSVILWLWYWNHILCRTSFSFLLYNWDRCWLCRALFYKISTANQCIKMMMISIDKSQTFQWWICLIFFLIVQSNQCWHIFQNYFIKFTENDLYDYTYVEDWIAFLAVYILIIQCKIHKYVHIWNNHMYNDKKSIKYSYWSIYHVISLFSNCLHRELWNIY
jgi:hypothetical protein